MLLEPFGTLKAHVPADNTGDIMGEVTKRRGRVLGMSPRRRRRPGCEPAEVPMAEMQDFNTFLRQLTPGAAGTILSSLCGMKLCPQDAGSQGH